MTYLSRDQALSRLKRRERDEDIPGFGLVRIRELGLRDRLDAEDAGKADPETRIFTDIAMMNATIVQRGVLDGPGGALLFHPDDVSALADARGFAYSTASVQQLANAIWRLSEADPDSFRDDSAEVSDTGDADADVRGEATDGQQRAGRKQRRPADERVDAHP